MRNAPLQKLNIRVRSRLPKGRVYDALRRGYHRLNTAALPKPSDDDLQVLATLREAFREPNARLSRSFDLDLSAWQAPA